MTILTPAPGRDCCGKWLAATVKVLKLGVILVASSGLEAVVEIVAWLADAYSASRP
jgi:hypothetical protein